MQAAVVTQFSRPLELREVPVPEPGPGQVLVRVHACGVCHTDLHAVHGDWPDKPELPRIPGNEAVGEVVQTGAGVDQCAIGDTSLLGGAQRHPGSRTGSQPTISLL